MSNFNRFGKIYRVMMQSNPESRVSPETLKNIKIRNGAEMAPIENFVKLTRVYGPDLLNRFNLFNSISVNGSPAPATLRVTPSLPSSAWPRRACLRASALNTPV